MKTVYYIGDKYEYLSNSLRNNPLNCGNYKILEFNSDFYDQEINSKSKNFTKLMGLIDFGIPFGCKSENYFTVHGKEITNIVLIRYYNLYKDLGIRIDIKKYECKFGFNEVYIFFVYILTYHDEEYTFEKFINEDIERNNWLNIFEKNKIYKKPIFNKNFIRLDKINTLQPYNVTGRRYLPSFSISVINQHKYVQWLKSEKEEIISLTYKIKKL